MRRCGFLVRERLPTRSHVPMAVTAEVDNFVSVFVDSHPLPIMNVERGAARSVVSLGWGATQPPLLRKSAVKTEAVPKIERQPCASLAISGQGLACSGAQAGTDRKARSSASATA